MPRLARIVFAGIPHHIMQRGNRRADVFFERITEWSAWLAEEDEYQRGEIVRRNVHKNLPCGSDAFVEHSSKLELHPAIRDKAAEVAD